MTENRTYSPTRIRNRLLRHSQDLRSVKGMEWLVEVVEILRRDADVVPPPAERVDTIPKYIYPR